MRPSSKTVCVPLAMSRATAICRSPVQHYRKLVGLRGNAPGTCAARCSGRSCFCAEGYQMAGMDVVLDPTWTIVSGPPLGRVRRLTPELSASPL